MCVRGSAEPALLLAGLHLLVVDDDETAREALTAALEFLGAIVTAVVSAADARRALERVRPHAILSDLRMPREDGCAFIASVRATPGRARRIPAAAVTACRSRAEHRRALDSGFSMVLPKPFDVQAVAGAVIDLCKRRRRARH